MRRGSLAGRSTRLGIPTRRACPHAADGWSLSAASDSVGAAFTVWELAYFGDVVGCDGDYYELGDVVADLNMLGRIAGIMQADFDGAAIPTVDDAGAVTEHQMPLNTGAAAHEHHAHMSTWHSDVYAGVSYPVGAHGYGEVVFQGQVHASVVFVGLARMRGTIIEGVVKQRGSFQNEKAPPVDY